MATVRCGDAGERHQPATLKVFRPQDNEAGILHLRCEVPGNHKGFPIWVKLSRDEALQLIADSAIESKTPES